MSKLTPLTRKFIVRCSCVHLAILVRLSCDFLLAVRTTQDKYTCSAFIVRCEHDNGTGTLRRLRPYDNTPNQCTNIINFFSLCTSPAEVTDQNMALPPQRLLVLDLELQLQEAQERHDVILMTLIRQRQRENARRYRRWWVKPLIMRK